MRTFAIITLLAAVPAWAQPGVTTKAAPVTIVTKQQLTDSVTGGMLSKGNLATRFGADRISVERLWRHC